MSWSMERVSHRSRKRYGDAPDRRQGCDRTPGVGHPAEAADIAVAVHGFVAVCAKTTLAFGGA